MEPSIPTVNLIPRHLHSLLFPLPGPWVLAECCVHPQTHVGVQEQELRPGFSPQPPPLFTSVSTSVNWEESLSLFRGMEKGWGSLGVPGYVTLRGVGLVSLFHT